MICASGTKCGDLHQTSTPRLVRIDQKTNCGFRSSVRFLEKSENTSATYAVVDTRNDIDGFIGAKGPFEDTCCCLFLSVK